MWELTKETIDLPLGCLASTPTDIRQPRNTESSSEVSPQCVVVTEAGSYFRLMDSWFTQLKVQAGEPSLSSNERQRL